jgi:hypothetical protein
MAIDLNKRIASVGVILTKKQLPNVKAQVGVAFDISGSMQGLYRDGTVQDTAERVLAIAHRFDDNQSLDAWTFSNGSDELEAVTMENYPTFVQDEIFDNDSINKWGGTNYSPVMMSILNEYYPTVKTISGKILGLFGGKSTSEIKAKVDYPSYVIVITDGENDDKSVTLDLLNKVAGRNIYWQFIGIGNAGFAFLKQVSAKLDNVGLITVDDLTKISDDDLYLQLLDDKFCNWMKSHITA